MVPAVSKIQKAMEQRSRRWKRLFLYAPFIHYVCSLVKLELASHSLLFHQRPEWYWCDLQGSWGVFFPNAIFDGVNGRS